MDEVVIRVENVSKDFLLPHEKVNSVKGLFTGITKKSSRKKEKQHALKDISFEIKKGEFFGIVGRNGSGKSTLLKILANIYQPTKGKVYTCGKLVPFIELGVGFNPELSGRENVYLNGAMLGFSEKEVDAMYDDVVSFAELERFMDQKLKNYSSGMQVRLAFAMAVQAKADILLIDEVLAVGDADFQRKCYDYFNYLKRTATTVVFVSHDMEAVRQYCDRAILVNDAVVIHKGNADKIGQEYLKIFSKSDESKFNSGTQKRWGEGDVIVESLTAKLEGNMIVIRQKIKANNNLKNPVAGFMIKAADGRPVTGTNNKLERKDLGILRKGQQIELVWQLPNIFSDNRYFIDVSMHDENQSVVFDWWEEATSIHIKRSREMPFYSIDPGFSLEIKGNQ